MDTNNNIIEVISSLTEIYESLNKNWSSVPCTVNAYLVFRQEKYYEAYQKLKAVNIESLALGIITNALDEKILIRLRNLLNENVQIYKIRQSDFTGIDFDKAYSLHEKQLFASKLELLAKDREIIQDYPYPTERERQMLLKENTTERNLLENERFDYIRSNTWMLKDYYTLIYEISRKSLSIIDSYFPIEKEKVSKEIKKPAIKPGLYFDMKLISSIHHECNNIQFENLTEVDFYAILNLQPTNAELSVKPGEKTRMSFLIYKLYEHLKTDNKKEWRTAILEATDIDEKYYGSKYKDPESEIPSRKSESFAQRINRIFK